MLLNKYITQDKIKLHQHVGRGSGCQGTYKEVTLVEKENSNTHVTQLYVTPNSSRIQM